MMPSEGTEPLITNVAFMGQKSYQSTVQRLKISVSTVGLVVKRFYQYGHVLPSQIGLPDITTLPSRSQMFVLVGYK